MSHFTEPYADFINEKLHYSLQSTWFYKQEIYEIPGLLTALFVTYDGIDEDIREHYLEVTWEQFVQRMSQVKPDWANFSRDLMAQFAEQPGKTMGGWEGRTIYFIKGGSNPEFWQPAKAAADLTTLMVGSSLLLGDLIQHEMDQLSTLIPVGRKHFADYERFVRICFNFIFHRNLGEGNPQVRTEPGNDGIEIRDIICANQAKSGFWKDLKDKYSCSEIVIDAKNKNEVDRDDLRQLYCYLKPALGLFGFIVCRSAPPENIYAYNRTLFQNFSQSRGVLIVSDSDLRRMLSIARRGREASDYMRDLMSAFVRSV